MEKYSDFVNVFLQKKALVLSVETKLNKYSINMKDDKKLCHRPIYSLGLVEFKILKTYIETYLKTGFIQLSESLSGTPILFHKKLNDSFGLYVVKGRSLVLDLVTCYFRDAQREWIKLRKSREQKCRILKRCGNDFSQKRKIQVT